MIEDALPDSAVRECGSAREALATLAEAPCDLVILDMLLPDSDGETLSRVADAAGDAKVLVLSMVEDAGAVRRALEAGAAGYLPKSASPSLTRHALRLVIDGGVYIPEQVLGDDGGDGDRPCAVAAVAPGPDPVAIERSRLTRMQLRVLVEMARGASNKQIAETLDLSISTVKAHVGAVIRKLDARNRTQAVLTAQRDRIV